MLDAASHAVTWTERGIALAVLLQTLELWQLREVCSDHGIWRFELLRREHALLGWPLQPLCALLLPYRSYLLLLVVRLVAALGLALGVSLLAPVLFLSQVAICIRFRGTFNGGSDYMSVLILFALSVAALGRDQPLIVSAALLYIAVQATLSYFIAGLAKLNQPDWQSGAALASFVASSALPAARWVAYVICSHRLRKCAGWGVIGFELLFPLAWAGPRPCLVLLALGLCFHLLNARVFGLNRFVFAWAAAYPALFYCSAAFGFAG